MNVVERAKSILLQPAQTWPVIDAEPATVQSIYKDWLFIIAAILTPPDAVSQCIMAVPMYLLYEGGMLMARILMKMRLEHQKQEQADRP